jgi:hypothetical protein
MLIAQDRRANLAAYDLFGRHRSTAVGDLLETSGVRVIRTPFRAPNCNAHAERFARSVKEECLDRPIQLGERHFRGALAEYLVQYHRESNQGGW